MFYVVGKEIVGMSILTVLLFTAGNGNQYQIIPPTKLFESFWQ